MTQGLRESARETVLRRTFGALPEILIVPLVVAVGLVALTYRLSSEGRRHMAESDVHFNAGRLEESLVLARRAADLYVPAAVHVRLADERLDAIANGAESHRLRTIALLAWQAIRGSELKRPVWAGRNASRLRLANRRIGELLAGDGNESDETRAGPEPPRNAPGERDGPHSETMTDIGQVVSLGTLFMGGAALMVGRRRQSPGKWTPLPRVGAVLLVVGVTSWTFCLVFA